HSRDNHPDPPTRWPIRGRGRMNDFKGNGGPVGILFVWIVDTGNEEMKFISARGRTGRSRHLDDELLVAVRGKLSFCRRHHGEPLLFRLTFWLGGSTGANRAPELIGNRVGELASALF